MIELDEFGNPVAHTITTVAGSANISTIMIGPNSSGGYYGQNYPFGTGLDTTAYVGPQPDCIDNLNLICAMWKNKYPSFEYYIDAYRDVLILKFGKIKQEIMGWKMSAMTFALSSEIMKFFYYVEENMESIKRYTKLKGLYGDTDE